jgi:cytochrome P450
MSSSQFLPRTADSIFPTENERSGVGSPFLTSDMAERHRIYANLNRSGPVHRVMRPQGDEAWLITGYREAKAALTDPRIGMVESPISEKLPPVLRRAITSHMLSVDGPQHRRLRQLVLNAFARRRVERLEPRIQEIADVLLRPLASRGGSFDLIDEFAYPLPVAVICDLLGVPEEHRFRAWSHAEMTAPVIGLPAYTEAVTEFVAYLSELVAAKRAYPDDDLLSALVGSRDGSDHLAEDELTSMIYLLLVAGHETTVNLIANSVHALLVRPGAWQSLRARPEQVPEAVEALLRFNGPVQTTTTRVALTTIELGGTTIAAGDAVLIGLMAANSEDSGCPYDATSLDFASVQHLGFGHGAHFCLGAPLARLEARIALNSLLAVCPDLRLAAPPEEIRASASQLMNSFQTLPVVAS